ncbi:murein L,D-transpeptidase, partial [Rhodospirillum rubrum]|nr:murein L,D-transpeptidase [Rhodospirillum rubrum]
MTIGNFSGNDNPKGARFGAVIGRGALMGFLTATLVVPAAFASASLNPPNDPLAIGPGTPSYSSSSAALPPLAT